MNDSIQYINPRQNPGRFIGFLFASLIIFASLEFYFINNEGSDTPEDDTEDDRVSNFDSLAPNTMVYGFWGGDSSYVHAVDLETGDMMEVAQLPADIKKVKVISPERLLYINKTDVRDHGEELAYFELSNKTAVSVVQAAEGFGIDDYVISPNGQYVALWEVSIPDNQNLDTGFSRVYTVDLQNPQNKNLIYNEALSETIYATYPLAITDSGEVFMDTFEPNVAAGWAANGMYVSDFTGLEKGPVQSMERGTYGTQPVLSPDGSRLAFSGYDGSLGAGDAEVTSLGEIENFKQAVLSPNTVEILNLESRERSIVPELSNVNRYPSVKWDNSGKLFYSMISRNISENGSYLYDLSSSEHTKIELDDLFGDDTHTLVADLGEDKLLTGIASTSESHLGNLGDNYYKPLSTVGVYDTEEDNFTLLSLNRSLVQYIDVLPSSYFDTNNVARQGIINSQSKDPEDQLHLQNFVIKPTLPPVRIQQQSKQRCRDLASAQCNSLHGTSEDADKKSRTNNNEYNACFKEQFRLAKKEGCYDSPLYLYGEVGQEVQVKIHTQISGANAPYTGFFEGVLTGDGGITIGEKDYPSLDFDYVSAIDGLPRIDYGRTVKPSGVASVIQEYGTKLGLNNKEITDLIVSVGKINSPYVFVSFFSDEVSKVILPMTFEPSPDVYRNIVFYIQPIPEPRDAQEPEFGKYPEREGFTAVEVSYILDN